MKIRILTLALLTAAVWRPALPASGEPWTAKELLPPSQLAQRLKGGEKPLILYVGPNYLYRAKHIAGAVDAGMAAKPEGIQSLLALVKGKAPGTEIIFYCGCCPMNVCPNIRPAIKALKGAGFTNIKLLELPTRLADDWTSKGYPSETSR
ncbi:MAG: rhodanese-like domain-containing protein [Acidobacteria bacterium]|nr:rhodanese-like domain-containing protein [Acidobacteriota bacterium]